MTRSHPFALPAGPPPEVQDEIYAVWGRAQVLAIGLGDPPVWEPLHMALKPKDIIDTVTGVGKTAVSGVAGIAKRLRREEDDTVVATPQAAATPPSPPPRRRRPLRPRRRRSRAARARAGPRPAARRRARRRPPARRPRPP